MVCMHAMELNVRTIWWCSSYSVVDLGIVKGGSRGPSPGKSFEICAVFCSSLPILATLADSLKVRLSESDHPGIG